MQNIFFNQYGINEVKRNIKKLFLMFQSISYFYKFPIDCIIVNLFIIKFKTFTKIKSNNFLIESIEKKYGLEILTTDFYNSIIKLSCLFSLDEEIYFVYTFLNNKKEEYIAELMGISKRNLQIIKERCLAKAWKELKQYC